MCVVPFRVGGTSKIDKNIAQAIKNKVCRKLGKTCPKSDLDWLWGSFWVPFLMKMWFVCEKMEQQKQSWKKDPQQEKWVPLVGPGGSLTACLVRPLFQQENNNYSNYSNKATITTTIAELFSKCQKCCKNDRNRSGFRIISAYVKLILVSCRMTIKYLQNLGFKHEIANQKIFDY